MSFAWTPGTDRTLWGSVSRAVRCPSYATGRSSRAPHVVCSLQTGSSTTPESGFSQNTGMPAPTPAVISAVWASVAAATTIPSTPLLISEALVVLFAGLVAYGLELLPVPAILGGGGALMLWAVVAGALVLQCVAGPDGYDPRQMAAPTPLQEAGGRLDVDAPLDRVLGDDRPPADEGLARQPHAVLHRGADLRQRVLRDLVTLRPLRRQRQSAAAGR